MTDPAASNRLTRRTLLAGTAGAAAAALIPGRARASGPMVAAAFPNEWEDNYRAVLTPILARQGVQLTVAPALAQDQLSRLRASPGRPPFDALLMSPGQTADAIEGGLIEKIDPSRIPSWSKLSPAFRNEWGPAVTLQVDGIAYNPTVVPRPRGYRDLFENPAYNGKVAVLGFQSNTALLAWVELNKALGGNEANMKPMFDMLRSFLPRAGAIANNGGHQQTLFQQGEVAVFFASTNNVARLKSLGVPCEFVQPDTGSPGIPVNIHLAKGASNPAAVYAYMEAAISAEVQERLKGPPMEMFPTNETVALTPAIEAFVKRDQVASFIQHDWSKINPNRAAWTEEFNRIVRR